MEAHVIGFNMWVKAVEKAGTTDPDKVIDAIIGISVPNLTGGSAKMLPNHHITKPVLIGEIQADGQFDVVWKTSTPSPTSASARRQSNRHAGRKRTGRLKGRPVSISRIKSQPMFFLRPASVLLSVLASLVLAGAALAADLSSLVGNLTSGGLSERETAITALATSGEERAAPILEALAAGRLYVRTSDKLAVIATADGNRLALTDAVTGSPAGTAAEADLERVRVNNRLRGTIEAAVGSLTLMSPNPRVRLNAAEALFKRRDASALAALDQALAVEKDARIKRAMSEARAAIVLAAPDSPAAQKLAAIAVVRERADRDALGVLNTVAAGSEGEVKAAAAAAADSIQQTLAAWQMAQNVWYGISLGSVLLLAAIGLAITFGTMGVINMAHGEMVMLGAYTTFVVQEVIRQPRAAPVRLLAGHRPAARLPRLGRVGIADRAHHHPLPLRPAARNAARHLGPVARCCSRPCALIFGPTNREVGAPILDVRRRSSSAGSPSPGTALDRGVRDVVFAALILLLRKTPLGLYMRAVTQNRRMASAMGIRTPRVDALTFGLGSGIAGLAGVALSQIDNVSPNLGQGYIIDSFMVVVFGGVGNLLGHAGRRADAGHREQVPRALCRRRAGQDPGPGLIILFIQRRPRGLFALKGRAVAVRRMITRFLWQGMDRNLRRSC
jgi:urea transport system permease protein